MPIRRDENRTPRLPILGNIRFGWFADGRPQASEHIVFTAPDPGTLAPLAGRYGGQVAEYTPQGKATTEYRLISQASAIDFRFPFAEASQNWEQWLELWGRGGIQRKCDGYKAQVFEDKESLVTMDCLCEAEGRQQCGAYTRLMVLLPETPGLGVWRIQTTSEYARYGISDMMKVIESMYDGQCNKLGMRLVLVPKKGTYTDGQGQERTREVYVPTINLAQVPGVALPAPESAAELPSPVPVDLDAADHAEAHVEVGERLREKFGEPQPAAEPSPTQLARFLQELKDLSPPDQEQRVRNIALRVAHDLTGATSLEDLDPLRYEEVYEEVLSRVWEGDE